MLRLPILAGPSAGNSEDLPAPESTNSCSNDSPKTHQDDAPASLLALNGYKLPPDIIYLILSCFVPGGGLQVSNDPAYDSDLLNTRGLLKTSHHLKHELLRKIYSQPLRIYITNGKVCGCRRIGKWSRHGGWDDYKPTSTILLKKLSHLPLHKWPSITIYFAPKSQEVPCFAARYGRYISDRWFDWLSPHDQDPLGWQFAMAADCVIRQAQLLGQALRFHCQPRERVLQNWGRGIRPKNFKTWPPIFECYDTQSRDIVPKVKIVFEDPTDEHPEYKRREMPLWEMNMMIDVLLAWRWAACEDAFQQIKFPPSIVMVAWNLGRGTPPVHVDAIFPHHPQTYLAALQESFSLWWAKKLKGDQWRDSLVRYIKERTYYDFAWYLDTVPLKVTSVNHTIVTAVLRITTSSTEFGAKPGIATRWTGEFIAPDD